MVGPGPVSIRDIKRTSIEGGVRVTIEMDGESSYHAEQLERPRRVFFDLKDTRPVPALLDATLKFDDEVVREVRLGRHPKNTTRVVFDMQGVDSYSVFTLYNPFRMVIDFKTGASGSGVDDALGKRGDEVRACGSADSACRRGPAGAERVRSGRRAKGVARASRCDGQADSVSRPVRSGAHHSGSPLGERRRQVLAIARSWG